MSPWDSSAREQPLPSGVRARHDCQAAACRHHTEEQLIIRRRLDDPSNRKRLKP